MTPRVSSLIVGTLVFILGIYSLNLGTEGFTIWTAEEARRIAVLSNPVPIPEIMSLDHRGKIASIHQHGKPLVVMDFVFSSCKNVCLSLGYKMAKIRSEISSEDFFDKVHFQSISFDHKSDKEEQLKKYLKRFTSDTENWSALRINYKSELDRLMKSFGVIAIEDDKLGFVHNAAIYVVYNKKLVAIFDISEEKEVVKKLWELAQNV